MAEHKKRYKSDYELNLEALRDLKTQVMKDKESSIRFLVELGVLTKKGNLTKRYKNLCIPVAQG